MLATQPPFPQYFDTDGTPLDAGQLYFGQVNQNPETAPITVYWDAAGTQPASQPVQTLNGYTYRAGAPAQVYIDVDYSQTVRDRRGRLVLYSPNSAEFSLATAISSIRPDLASTADATKGAGMVGFLYSLAYASGTVGRWLKDLALSTGAGFIGWINIGTSAVLRALNVRLQDDICFEDFGAVGDGVTDDSGAILAAIARATIGTTPARIRGRPRSTYLCQDILITGPALNNNALGEKSLTIDLSGCILKGKTAATAVLTLGTVGTPAVTWTNGVVIHGGTIDMSLMANGATTNGLKISNAYALDIDNLQIINAPASAVDILIKDRAYTVNMRNINCAKFEIAGFNVATDAVTSLIIQGLTCNKVTLAHCWNINFLNSVIQSAAGDKVVLSNVFKISFFGGDIEGAAGNAFAFGTNVSGLYEANTNISSTLTYSTGAASGSHFGSMRKYEYGNAYGTPSIPIPTTGATTIFSFAGDPVDGGSITTTQASLRVSGDDGTRGWSDVVRVCHGLVAAETSNNTYGAGQPTRAYSISGTNLRVALSAVAANNVRVGGITNPG